jgi:hypothetical protein
MLKPSQKRFRFVGRFEYQFLESNPVLQYELASVGSFNNAAGAVGPKYGLVLVIEGKLTLMSFQKSSIPRYGMLMDK